MCTDIIKVCNFSCFFVTFSAHDTVQPETSRQSPQTLKKIMKVVRRTWKTPEKTIMRNIFKPHLANLMLPTPIKCHDAKQKYSPFKLRTVNQIKAWVNNQNVKKIKSKP